MSTMTVAIDGPAGSGKSSVSREAARRLGFGILDTGAAYRALVWACVQCGVELDDEAAVLAVLGDWEYSITLLGAQRVEVRLPGSAAAAAEPIDVTAAIRAPEIAARVSAVSRHPRVRERLNEMFRGIVERSGLAGVVIEGRDITTVVAPDAPVRLLLTASAEARAARRAGELPGMSEEQVLSDLAVRDARDAQVVDFFTPAPGVALIDTTHLDFDGSVRAVIHQIDAVRHGEDQR